MSVEIVAKVSADDTARRLAEVPHKALAAFVTALGSKPSRDPAKTAREAARLIHETDRVAARVAAMAPGVRDVFFLCMLCAEGREPAWLEERAWAFHGLAKDAVRAAVAELTASGLVSNSPSGHRIAALPNVAAGCVGPAMTWLARADADAAEPLPMPFLVALVGALVVEDSPRLTAQGTIHARWLTKAKQRMLHPACPPHWTQRLLAAGVALGVWRAEADAQGHRLRPSVAGATAAFSLPASDFAAAMMARAPDGSHTTAYGIALAERAFRRAGGDVAKFADVLEASTELANVDSRLTHDFVPWGVNDVGCIAECLGVASLLGEFTIDRGPALSTLRRTVQAAREGRWTVLPNYEVLVPADTPPDAIFRVSCIARLERVDRVAKFVLDRTTVARRAAVEDLTPTAVEILAERSAHPLPETLAAAVAAWDTDVRPLRGYVGAVVVKSSPSQAEQLRADVDGPKEIAPGVFFVAERRLQGVLDRARKRGVAVGSVENQGGWATAYVRAGTSDLPDLTAAIATHRKRLAAVVEAKPKPEPAKARPSTVAGATRSAPSNTAGPESAATEQLVRLLGAGAEELRRRWPHVHAAVDGNPDLVRRAERLPADTLRRIGRSRSGPAIRAVVLAESIAWETTLREGAGALRGKLGKIEAAQGDEHVYDDIDAEDEFDDEDFDDDELDDDLDEDEEDDTDETMDGAALADAGPRARGSPKSPHDAAPHLRVVRGGRRVVPAPKPDVAWDVPPPGDLRRRLEEAVRSKATVEILHANGQGQKRERKVQPTCVRTGGGHGWLDAADRSAGGARASFRMDRIAAIRG